MPINEPDWEGAAQVALFAGLWAALGRGARWARKERRGWRRWQWRVLLWESVLTLFCGFVGAGLAKALGQTDEPAWALIALLSYFGPEFIEDLVFRVRDQKLPPPPESGGRP